MGRMHYSDEEILEGISNNDERVIAFIYKHFFDPVKIYIVQNSGTEDDAKDTFQEAVIALYRKVTNKNLALEKSSLKTYFISICKLMWLKSLERKRKKPEDELKEEVLSLQEELNDEIEITQRYKLYQDHFQKLSEDCRKLLTMFLKKVPVKEITLKMNFSSDSYTKKRKFQCKEKLIERIKNDRNYNDLTNE